MKMIQNIQGIVTAIEGQLITLDVGSIGFGVLVTHPELYTLGAKTLLLTYLHWHQETGPQLFGFSTPLERQLFIITIGCSGVGPKMALSLLNQLPAASFAAAVALGDVKILSSLKGIGTKKAESIILQLQDKIKKIETTADESSSDANSQTVLQLKNVSEVLSSLNYSRQEISGAIDYLKHNEPSKSSFDELIRKALSFLAKTKI
jgi:Holliday junction DNA helicase RuvA